MHLISSLGIGGAERLLVDFARALQRHPGRPHVFVVMNAVHDAAMLEQLRSAGFPVVLLERRPGHLHPRHLLALRAIARANRVSIVHAHNLGSKSWALLLKAIRPGTRVVFTAHSTSALPSLGPLGRWVHANFVDWTVAISQAVLRICGDCGIARASCIDNGIDLARFAAVRRTRRGDIRQLINVGRFSIREKGQDVLVRALAILNAQDAGLHLTLMGGSGGAADRVKLEQMADDLGQAHAVTFLEGRTDVPQQLGEADLFVLPSREEGFGLAVVEAMAAGLPVVASRVGGLADIITDRRDGCLVAADDPAALADCIASLIANPQETQAMAMAGEQVAQRYAINRMCEDYCALYERLAEPPSGASS
ncbi:MAG: glycosyltransferase [Rhodobiaceae bacterium]|nr:glycosyltransferase [Rhodobiaceae bacterium]MCC0052967.1 glycosyltransferase [Rhodobiaceae bacterium]